MSSRTSAPLKNARRLVVKIGSSILVDEAKGEVRRDWLEALTNDVARLHKGGCEVVLVSSGAIRLGRTHLKLPAGVLKLALPENEMAEHEEAAGRPLHRDAQLHGRIVARRGRMHRDRAAGEAVNPAAVAETDLEGRRHRE